MRKVLLAAVAALALVGGYGCASDCEVSCNKNVECEAIEEADKETCISECDKLVEANPDCESQFGDCASCTDGEECSAFESEDPPCQTECDFSTCMTAAE